MRKRIILAISAILALAVVPAHAVFNEKDLGQTLSVLRYELMQENIKLESSRSRIESRGTAQHEKMVSMIKRCNELSLMLYSQNQDCTLDLAYSLGEVSRSYQEFHSHRFPFDEIVLRLDSEIDRYSRLIESLHHLPPSLDEVQGLPDSLKASEKMQAFFLDAKSKADRDSCLVYADSLLSMYTKAKEKIILDNEHYEMLGSRLDESYSYAQKRYKDLQKRMFTQRQDSFFSVLRRLPSYVGAAFRDAGAKYSRSSSMDGASYNSEWRGPVVFGFVGFIIVFLMLANFLSFGVLELLDKKKHLFKDDKSGNRKVCVSLLCAVLLFALALMSVPSMLDNHFFRLASNQLFVFAWLMAVVMLSILIRFDADSLKRGMRLYAPILFVGFLVISLRVIFTPNKMMNLVVPLLLASTFVWQLSVYGKYRESVPDTDKAINFISLLVLFIAAAISWVGYIFLGIQIVMWWLFQLSGIGTVTAFKELLEIYKRKKIDQRIADAGAPHLSNKEITRGRNIHITWLFDFVNMTIVPVLTILTIPLSIYLALSVFDLTEIYSTVVNYSVFNLTDAQGGEIVKITLHNVLIVTGLFFLFKYVNYLLRSLYAEFKYSSVMRSSGGNIFRLEQVNITLANNLIGILSWGVYLIVVIVLLKIPVGAVSIVAAGLATGVGLAMKDVLNNFIYGIQLMSGRLKVGDWIECDGIRGKVTAISYQSTQVETIDGAVMSFLNAALFNKNFKNLTSNDFYEFVKVIVGVAYGTEITKARRVILDAIDSLMTTDNYGRDIVDSSKGVTVVVEGMSDSSVNLSVKQYVLVSERNSFIAKANEAIYNALNANGIEIPFPQTDVHIKSDER